MIRDRILVILLALWGLAMIVPDLVRVVQPLGSFGFYANNDGLIYNVSGPFADEQSSPAWQVGIRVGDRLYQPVSNAGYRTSKAAARHSRCLAVRNSFCRVRRSRFPSPRQTRRPRAR